MTVYPVCMPAKAKNVSMPCLAWSREVNHMPPFTPGSLNPQKRRTRNLCRNVLDAASKHCPDHHHPFTILQSVVMHIFLLILRFVVWPMRIILTLAGIGGADRLQLQLWYISWLELLAASRMEFLSSKLSRGFLRVGLKFFFLITVLLLVECVKQKFKCWHILLWDSHTHSR